MVVVDSDVTVVKEHVIDLESQSSSCKEKFFICFFEFFEASLEHVVFAMTLFGNIVCIPLFGLVFVLLVYICVDMIRVIGFSILVLLYLVNIIVVVLNRKNNTIVMVSTLIPFVLCSFAFVIVTMYPYCHGIKYDNKMN